MRPPLLQSRRDCLGALGAGLAAGWWAGTSAPAASAAPLRLAVFRCDVTPPLGHPLCGGWIKPAEAVDDPLEALGFVLLGADRPIVICSVDWTGILNSGQAELCDALAEAAGTTPDRVAVHCVHQHNAPFACPDTQTIVARQTGLAPVIDLAFFRQTVRTIAAAAQAALASSVPVTHIGSAEAAVQQVASNRRLLGPDGTVGAMRGSSSKDPAHHQAPEGLIDPSLKTIAFYSGDTPVAMAHYYACHPMSYYGDGRISSDFCGLARRRRQQETPDCLQLYFNGCGGNIGAGKYNDGSPALRPVLSQRIYDALVASEQRLIPQPIETVAWRTTAIRLRPDPKWRPDELAAQVEDASRSPVYRALPAFTLAYIQRCERRPTMELSALHVNGVSLLHLPAECFVEYQLWAQNLAPARLVACAAYGDGGPWYVPTREAFPQGGYEVSVAWCDDRAEDELRLGLVRLLASA